MNIFIPVPNVVKAELCFTLDTSKVENVFHYKFQEGEPTLTDMENLATHLQSWWDENWKAKCSPITRLRMIRVTSLTTRNSPGIEKTPLAALVGTSTQPFPPNNATVATKWITGLRGRSYRGRTYHVGLTNEYVNVNVLTPAGVADFEMRYRKLITEHPDNWVIGVASLYMDKLPRNVGEFTPFTDCNTEGTIDSMRRRLPGRGQ